MVRNSENEYQESRQGYSMTKQLGFINVFLHILAYFINKSNVKCQMSQFDVHVFISTYYI